MSFRMLIDLAAKDVWDDVNRTEARRSQIVLGLRKSRVQLDVRYRHCLDEPSLLASRTNLEKDFWRREERIRIDFNE